MRRAIGLILAVAWLLAGTATGAATAAAPLAGTVTWVYDADTIEVAPHGRVRLLGIDAPEKAASDRDDKFTGLGIARKHLRTVHGAGLAWGLRNVKGRQVTLSFDPRQERRDRHGRLLAYVQLPDGRLLNRVLLEEGLVIVYRRFPFDRKDDFLAAEAGARQARVGLWSRQPSSTERPSAQKQQPE